MYLAYLNSIPVSKLKTLWLCKNGWSYDGDPRIMFDHALDINGKMVAETPRFGDWKFPESSWSLFFLGRTLAWWWWWGWGEGHWDSDKVRITELISWLTALMRIFCCNQVLSSMSCYYACHQTSVSPLLTALDVTKPGQPVPPQIHPVYLRFLGQTSIHGMLPQLRFHPFSYSWELSLSRYPPLPLYMIIKPKTLGSTSPLCTVTFFCLDLAPWLSYQ